MLTSKSLADGTFAQIFSEILHSQLGPAGIETLTRFVRTRVRQ